MTTASTALERKRFDQPDEVREFRAHGHSNVVKTAAGAVSRAEFEAGWVWSKDVKPIAGTESCQVAHVGYFVSGRMGVRLEDGSEIEYGPGDLAVMPPGHDAWTIGDETCVFIDWTGASTYAKA